MKILEVMDEGEFRHDAVPVVLAHMFFPDDDIARRQVLAVLLIEMEHKQSDGEANQSDITRIIERELKQREKLCRMAGDIALKMINECARGGRGSLEFASAFVSELYTSEETPDMRYPTDTPRLQKQVRRLKNSLHYWAAWQICQALDEFDFVRDPGHLWPLLHTAGLVQIAMLKVPYFGNWQPWMVPEPIMQEIERERANLSVPLETDFERKFAENYSNKYGR